MSPWWLQLVSMILEHLRCSLVSFPTPICLPQHGCSKDWAKGPVYERQVVANEGAPTRLVTPLTQGAGPHILTKGPSRLHWNPAPPVSGTSPPLGHAVPSRVPKPDSVPFNFHPEVRYSQSLSGAEGVWRQGCVPSRKPPGETARLFTSVPTEEFVSFPSCVPCLQVFR